MSVNGGLKNSMKNVRTDNRKNIPIYTGVIKYFPLALKEIAKVSKAGNDQHHKDKPLHWDKSVSKDHLDALVRHLVDHAAGNLHDEDGQLHLAKVAWRALAMLETFKEDESA